MELVVGRINREWHLENPMMPDKCPIEQRLKRHLSHNERNCCPNIEIIEVAGNPRWYKK